MRFANVTKRTVWSAMVLVIISVIAWIVLRPASHPEYKILDSRLHVTSCNVGVANMVIESLDDSASGTIHDVLFALHLRKTEDPTISTFSPTSLSLNIAVHFRWDDKTPTFAADLLDPTGKVFQMTNGAQHIEAKSNGTQGVIIWTLDPAPTNVGNYQYRMHLGTNSPPLLTLDVKLPQP